MHFDCRYPPTSWSAAQLTVPLHALDPTLPDGSIEVSVWAGDGICSPDEHVLGTHLITVAALPGNYPVLVVDITTELGQAITNGDPYISFHLRGALGGDRYNVGPDFGLPYPSITVTP